MSEAANVYLRFKEVFGGRTTSFRARRAREAAAAQPQTESSLPFAPGRDPVSVVSAFTQVARSLGLQEPLAQAELIAAWHTVAGEETAQHSTPLYVDDGQLVVQCHSTAWATQLRSMKTLITNRITEQFPDAGVDRIQFLNPGAPSWKRGFRTVPGRGPRDTYG